VPEDGGGGERVRVAGLGDLLVQVVETAIGYGVGGAVTPAIEVAAQPIAKRLWAADPSMPTPAQLAAQAAATGRVGRGWAAQESAFQGFGGDAFEAMYELALSPPSPGELLELLRRGHADPGELTVAYERLGIGPEWRDRLLELRRVVLSPADAAMARQQGFIDAGEARQVAALSGVDGGDADLLFELSGLPYGVETAIELLRRGEIDDGRFAQVVREGHTKTKYTDDLLKLRFQPLSPAIAAEALIRERIDEGQAVRIAAEGGLRKDDFLLWSNMLGRPPGIAEAQGLVNRGLMDKAGFHEVVARSDVRTEYVDVLYAARERFPSIFQMRGLIKSGAVSDELAHRILLAEGYSPELVGGIIAAAHGEKTQATKDLSQAMVVELYQAGLEDETWALARLGELGYNSDEAESVLLVNEARRLLSSLNAAIGKIHAHYVNHDVGREATIGQLDKLTIGAEARNRLLDLWDIERDANVRRLTSAQVGQALKHSLITAADAHDRWVQMGYPDADATVLVELSEKAPPGAAAA
jgi:hypothetical protein